MSLSDEIASGQCIYNPAKDAYACLAKLPLPGVVIFVHGVNSDGEWYEAAEAGLCAGLNARLARQDAQLAHTGVEAGQLSPVAYLRELDDNGFLNDKRSARTFITNEPNHSPVIRFRWGYKANDAELKEFGPGVWLNEQNYWGGGPFANGCTALPDLWGSGLDPRLFLWLTAQHLNPVPGRDVYACPSRHYYAHAGKRLPELVKLIRQKQADIPITIVCHSQGNMVGLAAAFYGHAEGPVTDPHGKSSLPIADNYVLCNPPYSLVAGNAMDNWSQRYVTNAQGESGRETGRARVETLANLFKYIGERRGLDQPPADIDPRCANAAPKDGSPGYTAKGDAHARKGRVTLYCNPHDQVISATTVQGIGWMGLDRRDIEATKGDGVFVQRVWAQGWAMGKSGGYHYWKNHYRPACPGTDTFWHPRSPAAQFNLKQGLEASDGPVVKLITLATAPLFWVLTKESSMLRLGQVNAEPGKDWEIPLNAPPLPESSRNHLPRARRLGQESPGFDEGGESPSEERNPKRRRVPGDPYGDYQPDPEREGTPRGNAESEAQLRYEHRARLRMQDRREGGDGKQADLPDDQATPEWKRKSWDKVTQFMKEAIDQNATDHSTIMTHPENAKHVLAYDVSVGLSRLTAADWLELRKAADWRLLDGLEPTHPMRRNKEYLKEGTLDGRPLHEHKDYQSMPAGIVDERTNKPLRLRGVHP